MSKINTAVYRMTHIENIPHILEFGITQKRSGNSNLSVEDIIQIVNLNKNAV